MLVGAEVRPRLGTVRAAGIATMASVLEVCTHSAQISMRRKYIVQYISAAP